MRSIDTSLLAKIQERNQTHWNDAQPIMSVQVSRASTTVMDSSYWTVEKMREGEDLGDTSVAARRFKPYGPPNRLYNIYIQSGAVKTATREYPDYSKQKWQDQFSLGSGSAVAIAFGGEWEFYRKKWQLKTYENPWLFWVNSGILKAQLWDDVNTNVELATNVTKVKAIRGWKNVSFLDRDQGVVAGYIKSDGKLYYRNYCTQLDGTTVWESERQVVEFTGTAVNLNMFITNDYRMGFVVEDNLGKIHWIITDRNWAGMAIAPERIIAYPYEVKLDLIPIEYPQGYHDDINIQAYPYSIDFELGYTLTDNSFFDIYNEPVWVEGEKGEYQDWGKILVISITNHVVDLSLSDIEIVDSNNRTYAANSIERTGIQTYRLEFTGLNNFNNVGNVATLRLKGLYGKNALGELYQPFEKVFYPLNLIPTEIPLPEVEVVWNE